MHYRRGVKRILALLVWLALAGTSAAAPAKVLRYALVEDATTLDPVAISDIYSQEVAGSIFEPLYRFDYLARPVTIRPQVAVALPEASADLREFTVRLKPGIYFADDPAFKGKKRELGGQRREVVAQDVVYAIQRIFDPRWKSPQYPTWVSLGLLGLEAQRQLAMDGKRPFDYAHPVEGVVAMSLTGR